MISKEQLTSVIDELNQDRKATFAEFIASLFKDKFIEIYLGDSYEDLSIDQVSTPYPAVFCGKVVGAYKEVLVISAAYTDKKTKSLKLGNLMFVNERAIRALNEVDGNGIIEEMFLRSKQTVSIKEKLGE